MIRCPQLRCAHGRSPIRRLAASLLLSLTAMPLVAAAADEPQAQVPGYYRIQLGNERITALLDGFIALSLDELSNIDAGLARTLSEQGHVPAKGPMLQTAVTAYLVDDGKTQVLIDAGTSACFGPTLGRLPISLAASGYQPEDIDAILITPARPDHLCGIATPDGTPIFPNATVWMGKADVEYWLDPAAEAEAKPFFKPLFKMVRTATAQYAAQGRLKAFDDDASLPAGIALLPTHGHTPGHASYLVDGGSGQKLLVWGDVIHYHAVQFEHPEATYIGDSDADAARAQRQDLLKEAAEAGWLIAGAHLPFPGLGHVDAGPSGFRYTPAEFSPLP